MPNSKIEEDKSFNELGYSFALGTDYYKLPGDNKLPIRTELELTIRPSNKVNYNSSALLVNLTRFDSYTKTGLDSLMYNVYLDAHNNTSFTPYAKFGFGFGTTLTSKDFANGKSDGKVYSFTNYNSSWVSSTGVGVSTQLMFHIAIDIEATYSIAASSCTTEKDDKYRATPTYCLNNINSFDFFLGLRESF